MVLSRIPQRKGTRSPPQRAPIRRRRRPEATAITAGEVARLCEPAARGDLPDRHVAEPLVGEQAPRTIESDAQQLFAERRPVAREQEVQVALGDPLRERDHVRAESRREGRGAARPAASASSAAICSATTPRGSERPSSSPGRRLATAAERADDHPLCGRSTRPAIDSDAGSHASSHCRGNCTTRHFVGTGQRTVCGSVLSTSTQSPACSTTDRPRCSSSNCPARRCNR